MTPRLAAMASAATAVSAALALPASAGAEVTRSNDLGFVSRHEVVVAADAKQVWLALISPSTWWRSEHTWSGDSANLTLKPQAGGCFCETIPEVDEPGRFTLEGSAEHMRVVQAYPEAALRMVGALGPLQSEPVTGVLTISLTKVPKGTRIVWEYNVGGAMRYEVPVISKAVDGVMGAQIAALAKPLGVVEVPPPRSAAPAPEAAPVPAPAAAPAKPAAPAVQGQGAARPAPSPAAKPPAPATTAPPPPATKPAPKSPSVDEAFGDLEDRKPG